MKKKIFITGGSGLLGTNWAIWNKDKHDIFLGINKVNVKIQSAQSVKVNFSTLKNTERTIIDLIPDVVINTIGLTNVDYCEEKPQLSKFANEIIPSFIAQICNKYDIPLVHISTDHLFDGNRAFATEEERTKPLNEYAKSKARGEKLVSKHCPKSLIIRTNFFGWGPYYRQSFSDFIIFNLRQKKEIILFNDIYFSPILIEHLILFIYELIEIDSFGIFNVVSDGRLSKYDFGIKLAKRFDLDLKLIKKGSIEDLTYLVSRPKDMSLSNKKLSKHLNKSIGSVDHQISELYNQQSKIRENLITVIN